MQYSTYTDFRWKEQLQGQSLPDFVRVNARLKSSPESDIEFEMWLPIKEWNGCLMGVGNGGPAGFIRWMNLVGGLAQGYAVCHTDMGTSQIDRGNKKTYMIEDFGGVATYLMTCTAKQLIRDIYGTEQKYAFFYGASTGGQQDLSLAQRYPEDYDGIVAGVPGNNRTHLHLSFDFSEDVEKTDQILAKYLNANNPDLSKFRDRGGKLIIYSGGEDGAVPAADSLRYYQRVCECMGGIEEASQFVKYYVVHGMGHEISEHNGTDYVDAWNPEMTGVHFVELEEYPYMWLPQAGMFTRALYDWVADNKEPDLVYAKGYAKDGKNTRWDEEHLLRKIPILPYPQRIKYLSSDRVLEESERVSVTIKTVKATGDRYLDFFNSPKRFVPGGRSRRIRTFH